MLKGGAFENIVSVCVSVLDLFLFIFYVRRTRANIHTICCCRVWLCPTSGVIFVLFFFSFLFYTAVWSVSFRHILIVFTVSVWVVFSKSLRMRTFSCLSFFLSFSDCLFVTEPVRTHFACVYIASFETFLSFKQCLFGNISFVDTVSLWGHFASFP